MPATKFAISMPRETMSQVDRAAKRLGMTRSRYIATVLERVARHERDRRISERIDEVLADMREQELDTVEALARSGRKAGTQW